MTSIIFAQLSIGRLCSADGSSISMIVDRCIGFGISAGIEGGSGPSRASPVCAEGWPWSQDRTMIGIIRKWEIS